MTAPLANAVRITAELRERLKAEFALQDGDETLEDTLAGASDLPELVTELAREALRCEAMADGMKGLIQANQTRKARLEARAERLRGLVAWALEDSGTKKLTADDMTLSMSPGKAPLIVDDVPIPDGFCRIEREPDRKLIRAALEGGVDLPFARLGNAKPTLTVRSK